ncbi:ABC transporter ATP-binding protein/permease [Rhodobacter sp. KR11]|uniref:ABC transporter ATP-binding protein n=1 Tax=Rhodobacter sp. KR11 TaxID=2974588 RepID=UPI0022215C5E|nr:ABC transporter ATP-binding protein [Rhodobacter sp. KR11]MCW1920793.1 ABC transporter ATP-binding protein/permease [Rhodobacter sp. KR11]
MTQFAKAYLLLTRRDRKRAWAVVVISIVMALFDSLGTLSVMPFLAVLANPGLVTSNPWLSGLQGLTGLDQRGFLVFLGLLAFALLVFAALVRSLGFYFVNRVTQTRTQAIGARLMETYLRQPYAFFLHHNSGDLAKNLLSEVELLTTLIYQPIAALIAQGVLLVLLAGLMVAVNPLVAAIGVAVLAACYGTVYLGVRRYLDRAGAQQSALIQTRFRLINEAMGGIKITKLLGNETRYRQRFAQTCQDYASLRAATMSLATIPRYAIEAVAFGGILLLAVSLMLTHAAAGTGQSEAMADILPLLGFYAFAGYRLMPAVQGIYQALSQLRYGASALDRVSADLAQAALLPPLPETQAPPLPFTRSVQIRDLSFRYPQSEGPSVEGVSLTITPGSTLGIVGPTGAGKTTFVDLLLGLLTPESGAILVDDIPVTPQTLRGWQADLGYVPQDVFLLDASVGENIALGLPRDEIDPIRLREAARMAQIADFIETRLPQGFDTEVGERGVRLSGGQRQRIGIARALYRNPGIIVFDEATSALDNLTEQEVVRAIAALSAAAESAGGAPKTVILIAHRISTVQACDQILVLDQGRMVGLGRHDDLYRDNAVFRRLVDARETG